MYPQRRPLLAPTFIGAWVGADERLPTWQHVFADPRAQEATEFMVRLLRERDAYEANLFGENNPFPDGRLDFSLLLCAGGRAQSQACSASPGRAPSIRNWPATPSPPSVAAGPISKQKLLEALGGGISTAALDQVAGGLGAKLRITRVDYSPARVRSGTCSTAGRQTRCGKGCHSRWRGALGAAFEISRLRGRGRSAGNRVVFRQFRLPFAGKGSRSTLCWRRGS